jgi:predicted nucleic acid-binding protein
VIGRLFFKYETGECAHRGITLREFTQVAWIMRSINDCLIAAVAIRHDVRIIHQDNDFDVIAPMTTLVATSG